MEIIMQKIISGFILVAILAAASPAVSQIKRGTGKNGESCTYDLCMSNCIAGGGKNCTTYCEKTVKDRKQSGICK